MSTVRKEYRIMDREKNLFFSNVYNTLEGAKTWFANNHKSKDAYIIVERTIKYSAWCPVLDSVDE